MAKAVNFAVVGLGMGVHHALAISNAKGANLAAVCDLDEARVKPLVEKYGCKGYTSYRELLRNPDIQVISIVTESAYHADMGIEAARAGKHLIMEKPIDITPGRVRKLENAARAAKVKCGCIFQSRMSKCNVLLKTALDKGKAGPLIGVHAGLPWFRGPAYFAGPHGTWHGTWSLDGGGSMMNQGIHTVDLMTFFGGPVERVCGFFGKHNHDIESEDQTVACLQFANGALGTVYTTTCAVPEGAQHFYCFGTKGSFRKTGERLEMYEMGPKKERDRMIALFGTQRDESAIGRDPMAVSADGHQLIMEDMVKAIRDDREPVIPLATARHAVEIVYAIYHSHRTGRAVNIKAS
jgi:predicted dehydrogenase